MSIAIKAENISKAYQIGEFSTGTITKDIERWWALMRGKEDPYLKIGETNDRSTKGESNIVWSLKDINFDIQQGDAVGIIGKNGAGKSTLLKILSRVTTPTTGSVKVKGRIASLLEVGTGFHPELTGKENIYLNGAILGMRKHEIKKHFDAIVDFSGVERYIDTPVKRYSSGMYVRLAFAVAAHLESEILIVDEVLAVGDAEFQKKCLGKMGDVSKAEGRTVLFVSHNMAAVQQLCKSGIMLENGLIKSCGEVAKVLEDYISNNKLTDAVVVFDEKTYKGIGGFRFSWIKLEDDNKEARNEYSIGENLHFSFELISDGLEKKAEIAIQVKSSDGMPIFHMMCRDSDFVPELVEGKNVFNVYLQDIRLFPGTYNITLTCASTTGHEVYDTREEAMTFTILDGGAYTSRILPKAAGLFFMNPKWARA